MSEYHLKHGGDVVWQIGTGYFGCRNPDGTFNPDYFQEKARHPAVKMIEIKLSQGAKPGHGGILPAAKVTEEIARIRLVAKDEDVISPPTHSSFSTPYGLLDYIQQLRELSGGKPIGFKLCIGSYAEFFCIVKAMVEREVYPDFITVDGAEGGTGAAPLEFSNAMGTPLDEALVVVHNALVGAGIRKHIKLICSGRMTTAFLMLRQLARGADILHMARGFMLSIGCVQSLRCNANTCPTGITTQDPRLKFGLDIEKKAIRAANFHEESVKALADMVAAMGLGHPCEVKPCHVFRRVGLSQVKPLNQVYTYLEEGQLLGTNIPEEYAAHWEIARPDSFKVDISGFAGA